MRRFSALISQISQVLAKKFGKKIVNKQGSQHKDAGITLPEGKGNAKDFTHMSLWQWFDWNVLSASCWDWLLPLLLLVVSVGSVIALVIAVFHHCLC